MDDDEIEVIDLAPELGDDVVRRRREPRQWPRGRGVIAVSAVCAVAFVCGVMFRPRADHHRNALLPVAPEPSVVVPATEWEPPAALANLTAVRSLAVVYGYPVLVNGPAAPRPLLADIADSALVGVAQRAAALLLYRGGSRVIVGPPSVGATRFVLPSPIALLPDADGGWWSTLGPLGPGTQLHAIAFPENTTPVAKFRDGYLLVNHAGTALLRWQAGSSPSLVAKGSAHILAISGDLVAWANDAARYGSDDGRVRITNLRTGHVSNLSGVFEPVTARFSPDRSRLAILVGGREQQYMLLADTGASRVLAQVQTASGGNGLHTFTDAPTAFQPVPFSWTPDGGLMLISQTTLGYVFRTVDAASGRVLRSVPAPDGLQQLVSLAP